MSSDHMPVESHAWGGLEIAAPSLGPRGDTGGNGEADGDAAVLSGPAVNGEEKTASETVGEEVAAAVAERRQVPPGILQDLREQVADFADFAHRGRVGLPELQALGSGGGITAEVVRQIAAELIGARLVPALTNDEQALCDVLMLALVAPGNPVELTGRQRESYMHSRGQLMLDVSAAEAGSLPGITRLVAPPGSSLAPDGGAPVSPAAVVIVGAAAIAERPFLGVDSVLSYARRAVFRQVSPGRQAETAGSAMRAARSLEIVVLLDPCLGGGVWIDISPATGRPAAALAIALPAPPDKIRFTHVPLPQRGEAAMQLAGSASR